MLNVEILEEIGAEPVTLQEAKLYCRIDNDYTAEDSLISDMISSARSSIEMFANISLIEKRILVFSDTTKTLWLPRSPVIEVESIQDVDGDDIPFANGMVNGSLVDVNGNPVVTLNGQYIMVDVKTGRLNPKIGIGYSGGYYVTYRAGFDPLPKDLKMAVLKQVATDYDSRENFVVGASAQDLSNSTKKMVQPYSRNLWL